MKRSITLEGIANLEFTGAPVTLGIGGKEIGRVTGFHQENGNIIADFEFDENQVDVLKEIIGEIEISNEVVGEGDR